MPLSQAEQTELEDWIRIIADKAHEMGLDPYPTNFEVAPQHIIYELGAYGLPARFSHWTFGRDYHKQKTSYDYGMSKIYEIVFNTNPTQAFLVEDNSMLSHKFVVAHVMGHSDFFHRNVFFAHTDRRMIETARLHADRIRAYEIEFGWREVEDFLDRVISIEEHFDPTSISSRRKAPEEYEQDRRDSIRPKGGDYEDVWNMTNSSLDKLKLPDRMFPEEPEKDLLYFLAEHGRIEPWQRDIIQMVREEMYYFLPQMQTKIMNEGWASFCHETLLETLDLTPSEHLEFRRLHSGVLSPSGSKMQINPYYVGFNILKDIKRRWDGIVEPGDPVEKDWLGNEKKRPVGQGMQKLMEVIEEDNDVSFFRKYLTESLVKKLDLYTFKREMRDFGPVWVVQDDNWEAVRDNMVDTMTNFGQPIIYVDNGDYRHRGELYLRHAYDGKPLDAPDSQRVLNSIATIWGRPVFLESENGKVLLEASGEEVVKDSTSSKRK